MIRCQTLEDMLEEKYNGNDVAVHLAWTKIIRKARENIGCLFCLC